MSRSKSGHYMPNPGNGRAYLDRSYIFLFPSKNMVSMFKQQNKSQEYGPAAKKVA